MEAQVTHTCDQCPPDNCPDQLVVYEPRFHEYGLPVRNAPEPYTSYVCIEWCPWCGAKLPDSLRIAWFEELERRGIDVIEDDIPADMTTDEWQAR